jgi:hypothetical protein
MLVVPCERTDGRAETDRQTKIMKLTVAFRNLAKAPNTSKLITVSIGGELKFFYIVKGDNFSY